MTGWIQNKDQQLAVGPLSIPAPRLARSSRLWLDSSLDKKGLMIARLELLEALEAIF